MMQVDMATHRPSMRFLRLRVAAIWVSVGVCGAFPRASLAQDVGGAAATNQAEPAAEAAELPERLLDRQPFDRITLNAANDNAVIETVLLDLPERRVPNPLPESGELSIRRLSHPSVPYKVDWSAIEKIEFFEQILLSEGERLTTEGKFPEAFEYLAFLATNYPKLEGLEAAMQSHLWREASAEYAAGKPDLAWPVLHALYLRNPKYPRLVNAVHSVSDDLVGARLKEKNYTAARSFLDMLEQTFPDLPLPNIERWRERFRADAEAQLAKAREALAEQKFSEAREAVTYARSIYPAVQGGEEVWKEIQGTAPEIRVGVSQAGDAPALLQTPNWAAARVGDLVSPRLLHIVDFGAEGGIYAFPLGEVRTSADGLTTTLRISPAGYSKGLSPATLALRLVEMASAEPQRQEDFAALVENVSVVDGRDVQIKWRQPHIRPEALLQIPLRGLTTAERGPGLWFETQQEDDQKQERRYQRTGAGATGGGEPRYIVERLFNEDEAAIDALIRGDVDVLDRVPPWQIARMQGAAGITLEKYRIPTIHMLIPNFKKPLLQSREFRRAISYGIDAENIVRDLLLGGQEQPGFRTLSGPFPAGVSLHDPVGYAYNGDVQPRPYEPRLASLLAVAARTALAKLEADRKAAKEAAQLNANAKDRASEKATTADDDKGEKKSPSSPAQSAENPAEAKAPPPPPLVLAHSTDPIARLSCQSIKLQLDQVGIPIKLAEFAAASPPPKLSYDLLYAELAVWEPMVDARRLLGPEGVAGQSSGLMTLALDDLARAQNWNEARAQLNEIHRMAHFDLPLLTLWQTANYFAYRKSIEGIGTSPVTLYQNISAWRKSFR